MAISLPKSETAPPSLRPKPYNGPAHGMSSLVHPERPVEARLLNGPSFYATGMVRSRPSKLGQAAPPDPYKHPTLAQNPYPSAAAPRAAAESPLQVRSLAAFPLRLRSVLRVGWVARLFWVASGRARGGSRFFFDCLAVPP